MVCRGESSLTETEGEARRSILRACQHSAEGDFQFQAA